MLDAGSRYLGAFYGRAVPCNVDYVPDLTRRWPISEHQSREITGGDVRRASSYGIYERGDEDPCRKQHGERRAVLMPPAPPPLAASCYPIPVLHTPYVGPPWLTYVMPMANTVKEVWGFYTERTCRICRILAGLL